MKKLKFYKCQHCGNVVVKLVDAKIPLFCCGEIMQELKANTVDASTEKHIPVVKVDGNTVEVVVGEVLHPMLPEHYINFVVLETENGFDIKQLDPQSAPKAIFHVEDEKLVAVYEYCNLHGLWAFEF